MNPSTSLARTMVDELVRCGVREAVLAPGSRSAPLALALHDADAARRLRLHVRVDERSAGFLALGLAKGSHRPVPVVTTSGTAAANLHPAVLEAHHAAVPLVVVTADRPAHLRGTGANQTTDQVRLFGNAVRLGADVPAPEVVPADGSAWRALVARAVATATGDDPGPVHLNVCFAPPLLPDETPSALSGRAGDAPWLAPAPWLEPDATVLPLGPRTVVVAGDDAGPRARQLAQDADWPLLAEPSSGARTGTHPIATYRLLLGHQSLSGAIQRVVVFGHPTLSRPVSDLLSRPDVDVLAVTGRRRTWADAGHQVGRVLASARVEQHDDPAWRQRWAQADGAARRAITALLADEPRLTGLGLARIVSESLGPRGLLVVGSSQPIRDLDLMAVSHPVGERRMVLANRGLAGIDGTVSTALGAALGRKSSQSLAYMGDLTFLHDSNGLFLGPDEPRPDLTVVVANDDGGAIFGLLEQGATEHAGPFERVFGTPTGADLAALCAAAGVGHVHADDAKQVRAALMRVQDGVQVVEVPLDRHSRRALDVRIRDAVAAVLAGRV
ncbi:MAG: 2-succinyl-5-enolpyruvyl-6-hydroxy-3-cyclohexene-1-carboxylic-acid synthase [Nocardioidaceae bacterium]